MLFTTPSISFFTENAPKVEGTIFVWGVKVGDREDHMAGSVPSSCAYSSTSMSSLKGRKLWGGGYPSCFLLSNKLWMNAAWHRDLLVRFFFSFFFFAGLFLKSPRAEIRAQLNRLQLGVEQHFSATEIFMPETLGLTILKPPFSPTEARNKTGSYPDKMDLIWWIIAVFG